jgi:succinate dehydrogenase / fumarate reductase flavoprotein subunit
MTNIPGLYAIGEANFSDHGANRLGASALMQGLADGYFVLPYTVGDYLAPKLGEEPLPTDHEAFVEDEANVRGQIEHLLSINGTRTVDHFHRELGRILWDYCGMSRNEAGLEKARAELAALREEFHTDVRVLGENETLNESLEKAGRVADFFELGELMIQDALHRGESAGAHFREESQTEAGEALRDDEHYAYVAAWEFEGVGKPETLHQEHLEFDNVELKQRSYA